MADPHSLSKDTKPGAFAGPVHSHMLTIVGCLKWILRCWQNSDALQMLCSSTAKLRMCAANIDFNVNLGVNLQTSEAWHSAY